MLGKMQEGWRLLNLFSSASLFSPLPKVDAKEEKTKWTDSQLFFPPAFLVSFPAPCLPSWPLLESLRLGVLHGTGLGGFPSVSRSPYPYLWWRLSSPCCCHTFWTLRRCLQVNFGAVLPAPCTHTCITWLFCALLTVGGPACVVAVRFSLLPTNKDKQSNALVLSLG